MSRMATSLPLSSKSFASSSSTAALAENGTGTFHARRGSCALSRMPLARGKAGACYAQVATERSRSATLLESFTSPALSEAMRAARQGLLRSPATQQPGPDVRRASVGDIVKILHGPRRPSVFTQDAEAAFQALEARWQLRKFDYFRSLAMAMASYTYASSASAERLAAAAAHVAFLYFLDDLCFDVDTDAMAQEELNGIERDVLKSAPKVGQFLADICNILRATEPPPNPSPVETALWELGYQLRRLSTPDWFDAFAGAVEDCIFATIALQSDLGFSVHNLESFTQMRVLNASYVNCAMLVELTNDAMLPPEVRAHPSIQKLTWTAAAWGTFVNDIFSLDSEVVAEGGHSFNLLAVLKQTEDVSYDQALRRAVELVNSYTYAFSAVEAELPSWESEGVNRTVQRYVQGLKELMAGGLHFHSTNDRYGWPDFTPLQNVAS